MSVQYDFNQLNYKDADALSRKVVSLPPANEVWGKVMFLHVSVILFIEGSAYKGDLPPEGLSTRGGGLWQTPPETRKVGGTHPTRMLSCFNCKYKVDVIPLYFDNVGDWCRMQVL